MGKKSASAFFSTARWKPSYPFFKAHTTPGGFKVAPRTFAASAILNQVYSYKLAKVDKFSPFSFRRRRINKYLLPDFEYTGGVPTMGRVKQSFNVDGGPMPQTGSCKFYGFSPDYVGFTDERPIERNELFLSFLKGRGQRNIDDNIDIDKLQNREMWSGGYSSALSVLREFANDSSFKLSPNEILASARRTNLFGQRFPKMPALQIEDLDNISVNLEANSGHYTSMLYGSPKAHSFIFSNRAAKSIFRTLQKRKYKSTALWRIYGRAKDIKLFPGDDSKPSTRAVWVPEEFLSHLALIVVQPLTKCFQQLTFNPMIIGRGYNFKDLKEMAMRDRFYTYSINNDWRHFDAHLHRNLIVASMAIIRDCYPDDRFHDRFFSYLTDTLVDKLVLLPPGIIYRVINGMPSGHPLVTIVNTLSNLLLWSLIAERIYGKGKTDGKFYVYSSGDDSKVYFEPHENLYHIDEIVQEVTGMQCDSILQKLEQISSFKTSLRDRSAIFLKRSIFHGTIPGWDTMSMLKKFLYRDKPFQNIQQEVAWIRDQLLIAPGNLQFNRILLEYLAFRIARDLRVSEKDVWPYLQEATREVRHMGALELRVRYLTSQVLKAREVGNCYFLSGKYDFNSLNISNSSKYEVVDDSFIQPYRSNSKVLSRLVKLATLGGAFDPSLLFFVLNDKELIANEDLELRLKGVGSSVTASLLLVSQFVLHKGSKSKNFLRLMRILHHVFKIDMPYVPKSLLVPSWDDIPFIRQFFAFLSDNDGRIVGGPVQFEQALKYLQKSTWGVKRRSSAFSVSLELLKERLVNQYRRKEIQDTS